MHRTLTRRELLRLGARGALLVVAGSSLAGLLACSDPDAESTPATGSRQLPSPTPQPSPTPTQTPAPPPLPSATLPSGPDSPNEIRIETVGEVPDGAPEQLREWAETARDFYYRQLGFYIDGPVTLKVADSPSLPIHAATYRTEGERISSITINVGRAIWRLETPAERQKVVAHEYFHVIQNWLHGTSSPQPDSFFLVEGSAEYAGYAAIIDAGLMSYADFRNAMLRRLRSEPLKLPPLEQTTEDSPGGIFPKYFLSALAVDYLVGPDGVRPLAQYFALRRDAPVEPAFNAAFAGTTRTFYSSFALWRRTNGV